MNIVHGDCLDRLKEIESESIDLVITDPPYFLDGLDTKWKKGDKDLIRSGSLIGGLPVGMKFDAKQGKALQEFINQVAEKILPTMKPGAFAIVFSQPRLVHRMAVGLEDAGFEIRDLLVWRFTKQAQFKAFSMNHFVDKMEITKLEKRRIKRVLMNRKTPQLRPQFETMVLAQKQKEGTFIKNWLKHQVGLIDGHITLDGKVPSTVMTVEKPVKDKDNKHLTVKPIKLIEYLIKVFSIKGQVVLDPFLGSGTTMFAALNTGRFCVGIEINKDYIKIVEDKLKEKM